MPCRLRDAFAVIFFVSVGMLFDPDHLGRTSRLLMLGRDGHHSNRQIAFGTY